MKQMKIDQLDVQVYTDKNAMGLAAAAKAAEKVKAALAEKGTATVILATGASQFEFLSELQKHDINWSKVTAFHLDEYVGLPITHPASFRKYLLERVITPSKIGTYHLLNGEADDLDAECARLGALLEQADVDVAFVGIGENGHLAFNDPPASFDDTVSYKVVDLDEKCRKQQLGEGWFPTFDDVPKQAISMTIPAIMRSKCIVCTVPDARKAEAVKNTLTLPVSGDIPASILRQHPDTIMFLDEAAAALMNIK